MKLSRRKLRHLIRESIRESWIHSGRAQKDELLLPGLWKIMENDFKNGTSIDVEKYRKKIADEVYSYYASYHRGRGAGTFSAKLSEAVLEDMKNNGPFASINSIDKIAGIMSTIVSKNNNMRIDSSRDAGSWYQVTVNKNIKSSGTTVADKVYLSFGVDEERINDVAYRETINEAFVKTVSSLANGFMTLMNRDSNTFSGRVSFKIRNSNLGSALEHADHIVIHYQDRADEAIIIQMVQKLMSGINNAFSSHDIKILTPEERGSRYKRRTFGSDTEDHSDTSLMASNVSMRFDYTDFAILLSYIMQADAAETDADKDSIKKGRFNSWNYDIGRLMSQTVGIHLGHQRDLFK